MILKFKYNNSNQIGNFFKITESYCIVPFDLENERLKLLERMFKSKISIIKTFISGSRSIGALIAGNKRGIILPEETTFEEFAHIRNSLPDNIVVRCSVENTLALGNCITNNDYSGIIQLEISQEFEEMISDTLDIELFRLQIGNENLIKNHCIFNNIGGLVYPGIGVEDQDELSSLLKLPLIISTVNYGDTCLGGGIVTTDYVTLCGTRTTQSELFIMESVLHTNKKK